MSTNPKEEISRILERAKHEALSVICSLPQQKEEAISSAPDWMTDADLARYWRLVDEDEEPITAGIRSWAKRAPDNHPLPHGYMGDLLRFNREEVDQWAKDEAERRRTERERRKLKPVPQNA